MTNRNKDFHLRVSEEEHEKFSKEAKALGLTNSQLMRIIMRADITKNDAVRTATKDSKSVLEIRFVEENSIEILTRQIRRIGVLLNQATRALNDLRRRKGMSANYVAERLMPINEKVNIVHEDFENFQADWGQMKLTLLGHDLLVLRSKQDKKEGE